MSMLRYTCVLSVAQVCTAVDQRLIPRVMSDVLLLLLLLLASYYCYYCYYYHCSYRSEIHVDHCSE